MHILQYEAFADIDPVTKERALMTEAPFVFNGFTYATDRRCIIRTPGAFEGVKEFVPGASDEKLRIFCTQAEKFFSFFESPKGELRSFDSLHLEPVLKRVLAVGTPIDFENPPFNEPYAYYVACSTLAKLHGRAFDAKRLLYIRQTLKKPSYYDEPDAAFDVPLRFIFGASGEGQGLLMPMRNDNEESAPMHWNGVRYHHT